MLNIHVNKEEVNIKAEGSLGLMVAELTCAIDKLVTGIAEKHSKLDRELILDKMYESLIDTWKEEDEEE